MAKQDAPVARAYRARRVHVSLFPDCQNLSAHKAGDIGPSHERQRHAYGDETGAEHRGHGHRQQNYGEGEHDVGDAHNEIVHDAGEESGNQPQQSAGHHRQAAHEDADDQRGAQAEDNACKDVPSQLIGAEQVALARCEGRRDRLAVLFAAHFDLRRVADDVRCEDCQQHEDENDSDADQRQAILTEAPPVKRSEFAD